MRVGTWNLDGRKLNAEHLDVLAGHRCDIWLLTELQRTSCDQQGGISGFTCHLSSGVMSRGQHFAAVASHLPMNPLHEPHAASAAAEIAGVTFCSSILPWAGCGDEPPWKGKKLAEKVAETLKCLLAALPRQKLVWGGDWNQNLAGRWESVGTLEGQAKLQQALQELGLQVPTTGLLHQNGVSHSIDHIAIPIAWNVVTPAQQIKTPRLSDHDAYVVEVLQLGP